MNCQIKSDLLHIEQDLTAWAEDKLAQLGDSLNLIRMNNQSVSQLTLNAEVLAKISNGGLRVQGDSDGNDILNLSSDFVKATNSPRRGYDLYQSSFEGEELNLLVQNNIDVNIIG